mmetsp:Transcript_12774/g.31890  ORF Transcript_12774/g.31890 Transcript_12774/m.31890 type:complete len:294 (+) Transcript_12774:61-942(+)
MLSLVATPLSLVQTGAMPMHHTLAPMSDVFMGAKAKPKPKKTASAAPAAPKKKITTLKTIGTYIDVTGKEYQEANVFIPQFDEIGVLPPIGRWDPLKIREQGPERYRRFVEMEIKHGRFAMAAVLHVVLTEAGVRWPGYLSIAEDIKFSDMPGGAIASWAALPGLAWLQIVLIVALFDNSVFAQKPEKAPGDVIPFFWVRYPDTPGFSGKEFKLNAERNNGRAAMMGITGMLIHEGLTGNPVWPIPVPPQPVLEIVGDDIEKGPARVGSFVLVSLGMAFAGILAAIPELGKDE